MPQINENELKQDNQGNEYMYKEVEGDTLCNIKKQPYLDIGYQERQNFNFVPSNEEEDNAEFSMMNPNQFDLDLETVTV